MYQDSDSWRVGLRQAARVDIFVFRNGDEPRIKLDPVYVDTAIPRWEAFTGQQARPPSGQTLAETMVERGVAQ
jgi:hypothetical protein